MTHFFTSLNKALQMFAIWGQGYKVFRVLKVFNGAEYFYNQLKQSHHYFFFVHHKRSPSLLLNQKENRTFEIKGLDTYKQKRG